MMQTDQIFANNFWGLKDDGFHVLTAKMNSTKKTFDEIKSFYNIRASLHEEFGRKLMKHAKVGMGREETGTLQALLSSAHKEMEWTAQAHLNLAQKLKTRLEVDLDNFILEQKDKRKLAHTNVEKAHRYKQSNEAYLSKVKEKYESDCAKLITLQTQISSVTGREVERMKQRIERTQHEIKIQEQEYKNACIKVADATDAWNKTWKITCDTYQGMEKKRLEFLRHSFSMYINVLSTATSQDQESYERFWKSLDQYDPINDIQVFINEKGTGPHIPEPEIFVDYMDDPTKTFQQHTIANFPSPPELINSVSSPTDQQMKPELNVRNPTQTSVPSPIDTTAAIINQQEDSTLLQRTKSTASSVPSSSSSSKNVTLEQPLPSKSTSGRNKSIIRSLIKPLPSISTPIMQRSKLHEIDSSNNRPKLQQSVQQPPSALVIPEISSSSTTSASDDESPKESASPNFSRKARKEEDDGDITIDPRAKVVFAIGNNMFDLGHLDLEENKKAETSLLRGDRTSTNRRAPTRRRQPSADLEAACNFSYQSLLEELGVFDKSDKSNSSSSSQLSSNKSPIKKIFSDDDESKTTTVLSKRMSVREKRSSMLQQQQQQQPIPIISDSTATYRNSTHGNNMVGPQITIDTSNQKYHQEHLYTNTTANVDVYSRQQPHHPYYSQQQYTGQTISPQHQPIIHVSPYHTTAPMNVYNNPPITIAQTGQQPTLFWVIAIGDWYSGKPEELQYTRGTWMAVTETRADGWYYATKFDSKLNMLSNEKGFVAQNYVQAHHA